MFKWVHISDLHFYDPSKKIVVDEMREDLLDFLSSVTDVEALFITGDLRYAPAGETASEEVVEYISKLVKALKLQMEQVYIVPGNHDLRRDAIRDAVLQQLRGGKYQQDDGYFDNEIVQKLKSDFSYFQEVEKNLFGKSFMFNDDYIHCVRKNEQVNVLMLNTAITAGDDNDRLNLFLGTRYLKEALTKLDSDKPTFMIGHHGGLFLNEKERKSIQARLKKHNIGIYL